MTKYDVNNIVEVDGINDIFIIRAIDKIYLGENRYTDFLTLKSIYTNKTLITLLDTLVDENYVDMKLIESISFNRGFNEIFLKPLTPIGEFIERGIFDTTGNSRIFNIEFDRAYIGSVGFYCFENGDIYSFKLLDGDDQSFNERITLQKLPLVL